MGRLGTPVIGDGLEGDLSVAIAQERTDSPDGTSLIDELDAHLEPGIPLPAVTV